MPEYDNSPQDSINRQTEVAAKRQAFLELLKEPTDTNPEPNPPKPKPTQDSPLVTLKQAGQQESPWLTQKQAGKYVKVHPKTIYRWVREGHLPQYRLGGIGHPRYKREDLDRLLGVEVVGIAKPS